MSAGPGSIAYKHEPDGDYMGSPTDSTYKLPGKDPTAEDISFENALQRMGVPTDPETVDAIAQTFEGAISLSWTQTTPWYLNHVYGSPPDQSGDGPYDYTWSFPSGPGSDWRVQSARFYVGLNTAAAPASASSRASCSETGDRTSRSTRRSGRR